MLYKATVYKPSLVQCWSVLKPNTVQTQTRTMDVFNTVQTQLHTMLAFNVVWSRFIQHGKNPLYKSMDSYNVENIRCKNLGLYNVDKRCKNPDSYYICFQCCINPASYTLGFQHCMNQWCTRQTLYNSSFYQYST